MILSGIMPIKECDVPTSHKLEASAALGRIAIFVYDDVEPIDIGGTYGVFSMAKRVVPELTFFTVAEADRVIELSSGLRMLPDYSFANCPDADALIICGGPGWIEQRENPAVIAFIKSRAPATIVASVCTGGLILAATGLLDGLPATTRRRGIGDEESPLDILGHAHRKTNPIEALLVDCGGIVTGGGVSLAIDTSLHLIGKLFGAAAAQSTAKTIEYDAAWTANKQRLPVIDTQLAN